MFDSFVQRMEGFGALTDDHLRKLGSLSGWSHTFKSGSVVVRYDERPFTANIMLSGWAYRYKVLPNGRRQITALFLPGDICDSHASPSGAAD